MPSDTSKRLQVDFAGPAKKQPMKIMSSKIPEEEAVQGALIQVATEKQAAQYGPLLKRNVEGVKLEAVHCLKLEAIHCLSLRMQCESVVSSVFQAFSRTILFLRLVLLQKAPDREQSFPFATGRLVRVVRIDLVAGSVHQSFAPDTIRARLAALL